MFWARRAAAMLLVKLSPMLPPATAHLAPRAIHIVLVSPPFATITKIAMTHKYAIALIEFVNQHAQMMRARLVLYVLRKITDLFAHVHLVAPAILISVDVLFCKTSTNVQQMQTAHHHWLA